jgi:hypothetical protein
MARRGGRRTAPRRNVQELATVLHGINLAGDIVRVHVYTKGRDVRLSGPRLRSFPVPGQNSGNVDGWKGEAALRWDLSNVIDIAPGSFLEKETLGELERIAAERKKHLSDWAKTHGEVK